MLDGHRRENVVWICYNLDAVRLSCAPEMWLEEIGNLGTYSQRYSIIRGY